MEDIEKYYMDYYISSCGRFKSLAPIKNCIKSTKTILITYCDESKLYTASLNEVGGPIICNKNKSDLIDKFKEALNCCFGVNALMSFNIKKI